MKTIKASLLLATLALLSPSTTAQEGTILNPAALPQCAFQCGTLLSAQNLCVPPIAPVQDQGIYQSCFCNSNYLANYKAGAVSPTCDDACTSAGDRQAILQWYTGLCNGGVVVIPQGNAVNPNVATIPAATNAAGGGTTTTTAASGARSQSNGGHKSWISTHYQWIIMIIVLLLAGIGATILGVWLKRRRDRKWATGGHTQDSMLRTHDVTSSLGNRHPDPSMMSMSEVVAAGAASEPSRGRITKTPSQQTRNIS